MGLVSETMMKQIGPTLVRLPQYAYMAKRSCEDAIVRIVRHCHQVREVLQEHSLPIHKMASQQELPSLSGGVMLSLDLSRAFDTVNRNKLFLGLSKLGISSDIINILKGVYQHTTYSFTHRGEYRSLKTMRGIRQGCRAAPQLWTTYVANVPHDVAAKTSPEWMTRHITTLADDFCPHQVIDSAATLTILLRRFGLLLDALEQADLEINLDKTVAVMRLRGKLAQTVQRTHVQRTTQGVFLKIPRSGGRTTMIRLVRSFRYLGVSMSYYNFEKETMSMRLKTSTQITFQLHKWLHSTTSLNLRQKHRLWTQCVFASARYGLIATGFTQSTLLHFFRFCMKQLRRIYREPPHLTGENHQAFLDKHRILDPLERLLGVCLRTAQRSENRLQTIAADDILRSDPQPDFHHLTQVLRQTIAWIGNQNTPIEAQITPTEHTCQHCHCHFATVAALRRHLALHHGERSGLLRQEVTEPSNTVPTCLRCHQRFSTWTTYRYHIQFVCTMALQEIDQVEHRLRVQELLQYAHAHQTMELCQNVALLAYFQHHCVLCSMYMNTFAGLMRHWNSHHTDVYTRHHVAFDFYCSQIDVGNPCLLCHTSYKQYHRCVLVRQLSLLLTDQDLVQQYCHGQPTINLKCDFCGKAYTTKHGLAQHVKQYHSASEAGTFDNWPQTEMHCLMFQAVISSRCEDILDNEALLTFLTRQCLECNRQFSRKQELLRHLRDNHAHDWNQMMAIATALEATHRPPQTCFCRPVQHRTKHVCVAFLQYALARLVHGRERDQPAHALQAPDVLLTTQELVEQMLELGHMRLYYSMPELKLALTLRCVTCGFSCRNDTDLEAHLRKHHSVHLQDSVTLLRLLRWTMFQDLGCTCNPVRGLGSIEHNCPSLMQLAIIGQQSHLTLILPWIFRTNELIPFMGDLLPTPDMMRIGRYLLTRQFEKLWTDGALLHLLRTQCIICGEIKALDSIKAHLLVEHELTETRALGVLSQLCTIFTHEHSDHWSCDHCGAALPTDLEEHETIMRPDLHLLHCPLLMHMAVFLMHPVLQKRQYDPMRWPTPAEVEHAHQQMDLQRTLYNAGHSDTAGQSYDLLITCGLPLLHEELLQQDMHC